MVEQYDVLTKRIEEVVRGPSEILVSVAVRYSRRSPVNQRPKLSR